MPIRMSEFDRNLSGEGDDQHSLFTRGHPFPADFGEEERAFVEELCALFAPERKSCRQTTHKHS